MRRLFWIGVGAGAALYAQRKAVKFVRSLTPQNLAVLAVEKAVERGELAGHRIRELAEDVRYYAAEREAELNEAIELDQAPPIDPRGRIPGRVLRAKPLDTGPPAKRLGTGPREIDNPDSRNKPNNKDGTHGVG
ncbi:hypothetical protein [Actinocorallia sp. A-T 12471]|uniref:hypothetical protein n=1 Tax=Actinocorallia sp. A-T 12471 TaxID=3089813 RepID=UPI0029D0D5BC|nr:hypothetical protein [Actinocorallia sp. A-T 12471]MDX6740290.1 hypothetical protein [Actinocorallia sp. A-T 12471]